MSLRNLEWEILWFISSHKFKITILKISSMDHNYVYKYMWQALQKPGILAKVSKLENSKNTDCCQIFWIFHL